MKVLLKENVKGVGKKGEVVQVKDGYARNFLLPRGLAVDATEGRLREVREEEKQRLRREQKEEQEAREKASRWQGTEVVFTRKTGDGEHLFGAVTAAEIAQALAQKGFPVEKKAVHLEEPLKRLGVFPVKIHLHPKVNVEIRVRIQQEKS